MKNLKQKTIFTVSLLALVFTISSCNKRNLPEKEETGGKTQEKTGGGNVTDVKTPPGGATKIEFSLKKKDPLTQASCKKENGEIITVDAGKKPMVIIEAMACIMENAKITCVEKNEDEAKQHAWQGEIKDNKAMLTIVAVNKEEKEKSITESDQWPIDAAGAKVESMAVEVAVEASQPKSATLTYKISNTAKDNCDGQIGLEVKEEEPKK